MESRGMWSSEFGMRSRKALTLIEVIAALAILGTTATAMLTAYTRALHQMDLTRHRRVAGELADALLLHGEFHGERFDVESQGDFTEIEGLPADLRDVDRWRWTRTVRRVRPTPTAEMNEVHLQIMRERDDGRVETLADAYWLIPLPAPPEGRKR